MGDAYNLIILPYTFSSTSQDIIQSNHRKNKRNEASKDPAIQPTSHRIHNCCLKLQTAGVESLRRVLVGCTQNVNICEAPLIL